MMRSLIPTYPSIESPITRTFDADIPAVAAAFIAMSNDSECAIRNFAFESLI